MIVKYSFKFDGIRGVGIKFKCVWCFLGVIKKKWFVIKIC